MQNLDETNITAEVLERVAGARDPRVREISEALIRHLHEFVREIQPTQAEWEGAIAFLTETGQMSTGTRQEYILLSDALGVSRLVDAINNRLPEQATQTTVLGPFFYADAPEFENGAEISGHLAGRPMYIGGRVLDTEGQPIARACVDVWHSDEAGFYDLQKLDQGNGLAGRGRFTTDADGAFRLWTVRPSAYPIPSDGPVGKMLAAQGRHSYRPEHVHFMVRAEGYVKLVTHIFAEGDAYLSSDAVFGVKPSLIQVFVEEEGGTSPDGRTMEGRWFRLERDLVLART
jgi:hydroxyquinol 1,2-dioxygenase